MIVSRRSDWVDHGLRTLAERGPTALKIGAMADGLNVSRGSFYWHFRDIADFRTQLLEYWKDWTTQRVIRRTGGRSQRAGPPEIVVEPRICRRARERSIDKIAGQGSAGPGPWIDNEVAAVVASVDADRVAYIARLLAEFGVEREKASHRAAFLYWAYLGQPVAMNRDLSSAASAAIADICDLFRG